MRLQEAPGRLGRPQEAPGNLKISKPLETSSVFKLAALTLVLLLRRRNHFGHRCWQASIELDVDFLLSLLACD